jgi:DhnA family fructose-bisphosphate aldolase class Ia
VPVLALGSFRLATVEEALAVEDGGAADVLMGRDIFQFDDPARMLAAIIARVHVLP